MWRNIVCAHAEIKNICIDKKRASLFQLCSHSPCCTTAEILISPLKYAHELFTGWKLWLSETDNVFHDESLFLFRLKFPTKLDKSNNQNSKAKAATWPLVSRSLDTTSWVTWVTAHSPPAVTWCLLDQSHAAFQGDSNQNYSTMLSYKNHRSLKHLFLTCHWGFG